MPLVILFHDIFHNDFVMNALFFLCGMLHALIRVFVMDFSLGSSV